MDASVIQKMNVPELKKKLADLGLDSKGLKANLVERLTGFYESLRKKNDGEEKDEDEDEDGEEESDDDEDGEEESDDYEDGEEEIIEIVRNNLSENVHIPKKRGKNQAYNLKTKHEKPEQALKAINEVLYKGSANSKFATSSL